MIGLSADLLLACTMLLLGAAHLGAQIPGWLIGVFALATGFLMLLQ